MYAFSHEKVGSEKSDEEKASRSSTMPINTASTTLTPPTATTRALPEPFMGKALKRYPRESFYLATKCRLGTSAPRGCAEYFESQLQRCQVDYFDFTSFTPKTKRCSSGAGAGRIRLSPKMREQGETGTWAFPFMIRPPFSGRFSTPMSGILSRFS